MLLVLQIRIHNPKRVILMTLYELLEGIKLFSADHHHSMDVCNIQDCPPTSCFFPPKHECNRLILKQSLCSCTKRANNCREFLVQGKLRMDWQTEKNLSLLSLEPHCEHG